MDIAGGGKWARGHGVRALRWMRGRAVSVRERREWGARDRETKRNGLERRSGRGWSGGGGERLSLGARKGGGRRRAP